MCLFLYQLGEQRGTRAACIGVCMSVCVHPAQSTRRIWLCAAGWMKSPSGPQGMATLPWVSTQSGRPVAALPCPNSVTVIALTSNTEACLSLSVFFSLLLIVMLSLLLFPHSIDWATGLHNYSSTKPLNPAAAPASNWIQFFDSSYLFCPLGRVLHKSSIHKWQKCLLNSYR